MADSDAQFEAKVEEFREVLLAEGFSDNLTGNAQGLLGLLIESIREQYGLTANEALTYLNRDELHIAAQTLRGAVEAGDEEDVDGFALVPLSLIGAMIMGATAGVTAFGNLDDQMEPEHLDEHRMLLADLGRVLQDQDDAPVPLSRRDIALPHATIEMAIDCAAQAMRKIEEAPSVAGGPIDEAKESVLASLSSLISDLLDWVDDEY